MSTPAELGYRMPAEWERHAGTWLTWPRSAGLSFRDKYETVSLVYSGLIRHLVQVEEVNISVWDAEMEAGVRNLLTKHEVPLDRVHFHHFPAYEPCCRDHGPIFLARTHHGKREQAIVDWEYNAWGTKHLSYDLDNAIPRQIAQLRQRPLFSPGIVLEGGAIEVNGRGALLTTEACLLNSNRNPHLSQREIAQYLRDFLGVTQIIWLGEGIVGDEADGHIDELAHFVNPTTIVTVVEENPDDANYQLLRDNLRRIRTARDQHDRYFRVVELPMPGFVEH